MLIVDAEDQIVQNRVFGTNAGIPATMRGARTVEHKAGEPGLGINVSLSVAALPVQHEAVPSITDPATDIPDVVETAFAGIADEQAAASAGEASASGAVEAVVEAVIAAFDTENPIAPLLLDSSETTVDQGAAATRAKEEGRSIVEDASGIVPSTAHRAAEIEAGPVIGKDRGRHGRLRDAGRHVCSERAHRAGGKD